MESMIDRIDIVGLIFSALIMLISILLWLWHRNKDVDVDLTDLLMENGRLSRLAFTWLGAFLVMSFGFIYAVIHKNLSDVYAALYATTWAVPIVTKLFTIKPQIQTPDKEPAP